LVTGDLSPPSDATLDRRFYKVLFHTDDCDRSQKTKALTGKRTPNKTKMPRRFHRGIDAFAGCH
jgi:hypothetical protein